MPNKKALMDRLIARGVTKDHAKEIVNDALPTLKHWKYNDFYGWKD